MSKDKEITVLDKFRPLNDEELSTELSPDAGNKENAAEVSPDRGSKKTTETAEFTPETGNEETAAEIAPDRVVPFRRRNNADETGEGAETVERSGLAITGIVLSVLSLVFLPYLFAPIGIVLGYLGYRRGDTTYSLWAIGLGVVGLLGTFIVSLFV